jgi:ribosomal subunit interface protein
VDLKSTSPTLTLTPELRGYVERRFRPLERHFDRAGCWLHVELDKPVGRPKPVIDCRAILHVPGGYLVIRKRAHDAHEAVDTAKKALKRALDDWSHSRAKRRR